MNKYDTLIPRSNNYITIQFETGFGIDTEIFTIDWSNFTNDDLSVRFKYNK